jgi:hypothetical protein
MCQLGEGLGSTINKVKVKEYTPDIASISELFPALWLPITAIFGISPRIASDPHSLSLLIAWFKNRVL